MELYAVSLFFMRGTKFLHFVYTMAARNKAEAVGIAMGEARKELEGAGWSLTSETSAAVKPGALAQAGYFKEEA